MNDRRTDLGLIHIAKAQLGLDDEAYRDMLWTVARVRSAADLDAAGRAQVIDHLRARGFRPAPRRGRHPGRPHNIDSEDKGPLMSKIEALLADAQRPWAYATAIARKRFHVDRLEFCTPDQLRKLVAMLQIDKRRRQLRAGCPKS
jgi:phage gp16-like protein